MIIETNKLFSIYKSCHSDLNPTIIFTFPTSNGQRTDIINFNVLDPILDENIIIVMIQTQDDMCFYDPDMSEHAKMLKLSDFFNTIDTIFTNILSRYKTTKTPILLGCSMGSYYALMCFLRHPNRFHSISLGGMCDISILDKNASQTPYEDRVINYYDYQDYWDHYNPIALPITTKFNTRLIACYGIKQDNFLKATVYDLHDRIKTWNYIKMYDLGHDFSAWQNMVTDIFKGTSTEFHDFRIEFYEK